MYWVSVSPGSGILPLSLYFIKNQGSLLDKVITIHPKHSSNKASPATMGQIKLIFEFKVVDARAHYTHNLVITLLNYISGYVKPDQKEV